MATTTIYGSQPLAKDTTFAQGPNSTASNTGSFAQGNSPSNTITANDGGFAQGHAYGYSISADVGGLAQGYAGGGQISAYTGGFAQGNAVYDAITADSGGFAQGRAYGYAITAGIGGLAQGYASSGAITANVGGFAQGNASSYEITASGAGSFAHGYANYGGIVASAENSAQFSTGTNATADSLQVGSGIMLKADGDINFTGAGKGLKCAQIYVKDSVATITVDSDIADVIVTQWTNNGLSNGVTPDQANNKITFPTTGIYKVHFSASSSLDGGATVPLHYNAYLNGAIQAQLHAHRTVSSTDVGSMSFSGLIDVTTATWDLDIRANINSTVARALTVEDATLVVTKVAGT